MGIEKNMQASLPSTNKSGNTVFSAIEKNMQASLPSIYFVLKSMVTDGDLLEVKGSYKLSPDFGERDNYIYKGIVEAILDLKDPTGSSFSAIEKNMQASLPSIYFVLKSMVTDGDLLEVK